MQKRGKGGLESGDYNVRIINSAWWGWTELWDTAILHVGV